MAKVEETRSRLRSEALRLFDERGFDGVTVNEIAAAAGVSHMTFFRHFPTKEAVVMDDPYDALIVDAVTTQDKNLSLLERVRLGLAVAWAGMDGPMNEETRLRIRLVAGHPRLRGQVWLNNDRTADVISHALVAEGASRIESRAACGAVLGAVTAAFLEWASDDEDRAPLGSTVTAALDLLSMRGTRS